MKARPEQHSVFIMVGGSVETGIVSSVAESTTEAIGQRYFLASSVILFAPGALSASWTTTVLATLPRWYRTSSKPDTARHSPRGVVGTQPRRRQRRQRDRRQRQRRDHRDRRP